jgi:hypothetical protein
MYRLMLSCLVVVVLHTSPAEEIPMGPSLSPSPPVNTDQVDGWNVPELPSADMRLSWTDFRELLRLLQPAPEKELAAEKSSPPWPWAVSTARYQLDATSSQTVKVKAVYEIQVWDDEWSTIPILGDTVALSDVLLDGEPFHLHESAGWLSLLTNEPGLHRLEVAFFARQVEREGDVSLDFPAAPASVTEVRLNLGADAAAVFSPNAASVSMRAVEGGQEAVLALKSSDTMELHWRRPSQVKEKTPPPPPRVTAHVNAQMRLSRELLESTTTVTFEVLRGAVSHFDVDLPPDLVLLDATGKGMEWSLEKEGEIQRLRISLNHAVTGTYPVVLRYEWPLASDLTALSLPRIVAQGVARQDGVIAISALRNMDVDITDPTRGVARIDPGAIFDHGLGWDVLHAFRYHQPDYDLVVAAKFVQPRIVGEVNQLASLSGTVMRVEAEIQYRVLRGETSRFSATLPEAVNLLSVTGEGMDWYAIETAQGRRIEVDLNEAVDSEYTLRLLMEQNVTAGDEPAPIPTILLHDVARQSGWVGVATAGNVKVDVGSGMENIQRVDETELPDALRRWAQSPILHAFQYQEPDFLLPVHIQKLDDIAVRVAAIDHVELTSVVADEMLITRARYWVRNNQRQFLRIDPGPDVEIWGATVDGHVVSPAKDPESSYGVLLRMRKTQEGNAGLGSFPMELIYMQRVEKAGAWRQSLKLAAPVTDILADRVTWAVYLPESVQLLESDGDLKLAESISAPDRPDRGAMTMGDPASIRRLREGIERFLITDINNPAGSARAQSKSFSDKTYSATEGAGASTRLAGVLPVHINLPQVGVPHHFERVLLPQGEALTLNLKTRSRAAGRVLHVGIGVLALLAGLLLALRSHRVLAPIALTHQRALLIAAVVGMVILWLQASSGGTLAGVGGLAMGLLIGLVVRRIARPSVSRELTP